MKISLFFSWRFSIVYLTNGVVGLILSVYNCTQLKQIQARIPSSWLQICDRTCESAIAELWSEAGDTLPRFVEYLRQSTLAMVVADGLLGPVLV